MLFDKGFCVTMELTEEAWWDGVHKCMKSEEIVLHMFEGLSSGCWLTVVTQNGC